MIFSAPASTVPWTVFNPTPPHPITTALAPGSVDAVHLITEASRLAYADRDLYIGDTDFVDVPVGAMLDKTYLASRARLIEPIETLRSQPEPYIALRRNYSSQREAAIRNGETEADPYQDLPDFDVYDEESAEGTGAGDQ